MATEDIEKREKYMRIDGFIFDMDGILFDTERLFNECFARALSSYGITNVDIDKIVRLCLGRSTAESKALCLEVLPEGFPYDEMQAKLRDDFNTILAEKGMPVKPGVYLILEYLKANRYPVGLASSSSMRSIMHHLEEANMTEYFTFIASANDVEKGKPEPDIYNYVVEKMNLKGKNVLVFEDSPNGLKAATAAGLKAVMIPDQVPYTEDLRPYVYEKINTMTAALEALKKGEL